MTNEIKMIRPDKFHPNEIKMNAMQEYEMQKNGMQSCEMNADERESQENMLTWVLDEEGRLTVSGTGRMPNYSFGRCPAAPWTEKREQIHELVIGDGITRIGVNAFADCPNLRRAHLPESLRSIGAYAFRDCISLQEVDPEEAAYRYCYEPGTSDEPAVCITFGIGAFFNTPWALHRWGSYYCVDGAIYATFSAMEHLTVPGTCHSLQKFAFAGSAAVSIALPETLETIHDLAFYGCAVRKVLIPKSVKSIGLSAFTNSALESIELPNGIREIRFGECIKKEDASGFAAGENWRPNRLTSVRTISGSGFDTFTVCETSAEEADDLKTAKASCASYEMPGFYRFSRKDFRSCPAFERTLLFYKAVQPDALPPKTKKKKKAVEAEAGIPADLTVDEKERSRKAPAAPAVLIPARIPFESFLYERIRSGDIFLCVEYAEDKILCVRSFSLSQTGDRVKSYRMRPSRDIGVPVIWEDSYVFLEEDAFLAAMRQYCFHTQKDERHAARGIFHCADGGPTAEWFRYTRDKKPFLDGELELNLLDHWLKYHSKKRVCTAEENMLEDQLAMSPAL